MEIRVNGTPMQIDPQATLEDLLKRLNVQRKFTAIEYNGNLFDGEPAECALRDGDRLEIVRFVGGG